MAEDNLYLGIDGGGSKTRLAVADGDDVVLQRIDIDDTSNPTYGTDHAIKTLKRGIGEIDSNLLTRVVSVYAGIAGCETLEREGTKKISEFLESHLSNVTLGGDLVSGFISSTGKQSGLGVFAGTGTALAHIADGAVKYSVSSIAMGGRDVGYVFVRLALDGKLDSYPELKAFVQRSVDLDALRADADLKTWMQADDIRTFSLNLSSEMERGGLRELRVFTDTLATLWARKIITYGWGVQDELGDSFTAALIGSFWGLEPVRTRVQKLVGEQFPKMELVYNPDAESVTGCLQLARRFE